MGNPMLLNLWRWKCGLPEEDVYGDFRLNDPVSHDDKDKFDLTDVSVTEWSPEFENLMRNRLKMGSLRYSKMGHGRVPKGKKDYDRVQSVHDRIEIFKKTGNSEYLVDVANEALLMFEERAHPNFNFRTIDDGYHTKEKSK